jgi:quercetin dioxygenase-like cupin family protein
VTIPKRVGVLLAAAAALTLAITYGTSHSPAAASASNGASTTAVATHHPSERVEPVLEEKLPNVKGKSFSAVIVNFPPRARAVPHRHGQAFVFAYVLQGSIRSQVEGHPAKTYHEGDSWTEQPGAHHLVTANTSTKRPAKLLVTFVAPTGAPLVVDDPH